MERDKFSRLIFNEMETTCLQDDFCLVLYGIDYVQVNPESLTSLMRRVGSLGSGSLRVTFHVMQKQLAKSLSLSLNAQP